MKNSQITTSSARKRLLVSTGVGLVIGGAAAGFGYGKYAPLAAWDSAALLFTVWVLASVLPFSSAKTRQHALAENPGRALADALLLVASLVSLAAVGVLVLQANNAQGLEKVVDITLSLLSVVISWATVHTLFLLKYARLYYGDPEGGIDFNQSAKPSYTDFAYLAFTVGMTFQVSDTQLQTKEIRATVLRHALLAYIFGTVIIATTINTVVSLSN